MDSSLYREEGRAFSVTIGTSPRRPVFEDLHLGRLCLNVLREIRAETNARIYAFCLMPDHVHLLVGVSGGASLSEVVERWKSRCCHAARMAGRRDVFWQRSFYDHALRKEEDLRVVAEYMLNNPVRAGLVKRFQDYPLCGSLEFEL